MTNYYTFALRGKSILFFLLFFFNAGFATSSSNGDILFNCPSNIIVAAESGQYYKSVYWSPPTATTSCEIATSFSCASNNIAGIIR